MEEKILTNIEKIRSMADDEFISFLLEDLDVSCPYEIDCPGGSCIDCMLKWFKQPVKETSTCVFVELGKTINQGYQITLPRSIWCDSSSKIIEKFFEERPYVYHVAVFYKENAKDDNSSATLLSVICREPECKKAFLLDEENPF